MSILKVLDTSIENSFENYSEYLSDFKNDDLRGTEFMFFSLSTIFRDKTVDEIEVGIVDSLYRGYKYDFGIDAIFITGSKDFIENPDEIEDYNEDTKFKIHVFQFKRGTGVQQADLLKLKNGIKKILVDESILDSDNLYFFNRATVLNDIKDQLFARFSSDNISVVCHIVFGGIENAILKESILNDELTNIEQLLRDSGFTHSSVVITDAEKLINAPSKSTDTSDIIEYQKSFNYITDTDSKTKLNGFICMIKGSEIANLVKTHQTAIFEANIRDFYKRNDLNSKITATAADKVEAKFFWSYNNGLTMTCSKVEEMPNSKYKLYNLQIVNGCQTSNAVYLAMKNRNRISQLSEKINSGGVLTGKEQREYDLKDSLQFNDDTSILVKIIETKDEDLVYRITETTNSQTPIHAFSLKANDDVQKLIEKYLLNKEINYERRINSLRNKGLKSIYTIQKLFQLYTSQINLKPSQVKTQPKKMFYSNYDTVFPAPKVIMISYSLYSIPIKVDIALAKGIKEYFKTNNVDGYIKTLIAYGRLHLGCFVLSSILKKNYSQKGIVNNEEMIENELITNFQFHLEDAIENFERIMKSFAGNKKEAIPIEIRKSELDSRIARFIKNRQ